MSPDAVIGYSNIALFESVPIYVGHLRAHTDLPGPVSEGNALADQLTHQICAVSQESYEAAEKAHNHFHLNDGSLRYLESRTLILLKKKCTL